MTEYNPIFHSPLALPTIVPVSSGLRLSDLSGVQVTVSQGEATQGLKKQFSEVPARPGDLVDVGEGYLACLTPTEFYLFGKSTAAKLPSNHELEQGYAKTKNSAYTTDYTHGRAVLKLKGANAAETLSKICGLDFSDPAFPNLKIKQTSAAKIKTLIARCDEDGEPTYHLHVNRPFGQYFWETLWDAGQEFGIGVG